MYLKIPDILVMLGFLTKDQQISVKRSMYGNVDAALRFLLHVYSYSVCKVKILE